VKVLKTAFALSVAIIVLASCGNGQTTGKDGTLAAATLVNPDQVVAQLDQFEHEWAAAIVAKNTGTIDRLLADDFVGTTDDQKYSKSDAIEDVKNGTHEVLNLSDVDVHVFGDAALVTMIQEEKSRHGSSDFSGKYRFTDFWVKRNGEWRAVGSHGSRVR
jgi:ketosteroid isomerase-like protein